MTIRRAIAMLAPLLLLAASPTPGKDPAPSPPEGERYPCRTQHTFDFWVGTFEARPWDQPTGETTGQLVNTREFEGCVIVERWTGKRGSGMSTAFFDVNRHQWRMV